MENRYVEIKNATRGELVYRLPSLRVRRSFLPGMTMKVSVDELREGLCDYGVRTMFRLGYLRCVDDKDSVDLGLKEEIGDVANSVCSSDIATIINSKDNSKIYLMFKNADKSMQDDIINYLVQNKVYDQNIVKWCKDFFNYNLLPVLSNTAE